MYKRQVLLVPRIDCHLLSVSALDRQGFSVIFERGECIIKKKNRVVAKAKQENNLYVLKSRTYRNTHMINRNEPQHNNCIHLLHRRLGHLNFKTLQRMENIARGVHIKDCKNYLDCQVCKQTKTHVAPKGKLSVRKTSRPFELVHADLIGPFSPSLGGAKYSMIIVDDHTRFLYCFTLK